MTELDAELVPLALEVIEEYGKAVDYVLVKSKTYDPATGNVSGDVMAVPGVKVAPPEDYPPRVTASSGGLIEVGDKKITTAAAYFVDYDAPTTGDHISYDGTTYYVRQVTTVFSGDLPCLYVLQVRG
jgi:hypothetical protein